MCKWPVTKILFTLLVALLPSIEPALSQALPNREIVDFSVHRLFGHDLDPLEINASAAAEYHTLIEDIDARGRIAVGTMPSWVFPPLVNPPHLPTPPPPFSDVQRRSCIPFGADTEYQRLSATRNEMFSALASEFPEVDYWIIGLEPRMFFISCEGERLTTKRLVRFAADTLKGATEGIRLANPEATVIAHFLGQSGIPITARGRDNVQPAELLVRINLRILRRGERFSDYYDFWSIALDPTLIFNRVYNEKPPLPVDLGPFDTDGCDEEIPPEDMVPGWNIKCLEGFLVPTDSIQDDYDWWRTAFHDPSDPDNIYEYLDVPVNINRFAELQLRPPSLPGKQTTAFSIISVPEEVDFVPDREIEDQESEDEGQYWATVFDFENAVAPDEPNSFWTHAGSYLRIVPISNEQEQTRFGALLWADLHPGECGQTAPACGAVQISGTTDAGQCDFFFFDLDESPWEHPETQYRIQMSERFRFDSLRREGRFQWKAEIYNLEEPSEPPIGESIWVDESDLTGEGCNVGIPERGDRVGWGLASGLSGQVWGTRVGTSFWVYGTEE